ncbi:hypothetical protein C1645_785233 [Glomus cerebriforme]|uniref:TLDc domain-containing protein n=1 Tax=Glomus cerebriforme TaxID=658196 RepID=A0A397SGC8_9GLOM|nr:hypothetical protein C1645_785233 [Glomus cerebriforme]
MSRDGFNPEVFFNKCNGQGPFVVLIRVQSKKIYGDYNPIGYTGRSRWLSSTESFIFSFENDQDINNMKISRSTNDDNSILDCRQNSGYFFNFGDMLYVNRQYLRIGYCTLHYDNVFNKNQFPIDEIEVFNVKYL